MSTSTTRRLSTPPGVPHQQHTARVSYTACGITITLSSFTLLTPSPVYPRIYDSLNTQLADTTKHPLLKPSKQHFIHQILPLCLHLSSTRDVFHVPFYTTGYLMMTHVLTSFFPKTLPVGVLNTNITLVRYPSPTILVM